MGSLLVASSFLNVMAPQPVSGPPAQGELSTSTSTNSLHGGAAPAPVGCGGCGAGTGSGRRRSTSRVLSNQALSTPPDQDPADSSNPPTALGTSSARTSGAGTSSARTSGASTSGALGSQKPSSQPSQPDAAAQQALTSSPPRPSSFAVPQLNLNKMNGTALGYSGADDGGIHGPLTRESHGDTMRRANRLHFLQSPSEVRTETDLHHLDDAVLYSCRACQYLTKGARLAMAKLATLATFEPGDTLCTAGQDMECVYFVLQGQVTATERDGSIVTYDEGDSIGWFCEPPALDPSTPRTRQALRLPPPRSEHWPFTATAACSCDVAVVTQQQWAIVRTQETYWDAKLVRSFLEDLPTFGTLSQAQLLQLSRLVRTLHFPSDAVIFRQGQDGDDIFLLRAGFVRVLKNLPLDPSSRMRLNRMAVECHQLDSNLDVLATPRNRVGLNAMRRSLPEYSPRSGVGDDAARGQSESGDGGNDQGAAKPASPLRVSRAVAAGAAAAADVLARDRVRRDSAAGGFVDLSTAAAMAREDKRREAAAAAAAAAAEKGGVSIGALATEGAGLRGASPRGGGIDQDLLGIRAFSSQTPFLLPDERVPQVFVEVATICSGTIFGECTAGRRVHRSCSAVADTRVEVFQLVRSEVKQRLGDALQFLWSTDREMGKNSSDEAIKAQLEKNMSWELYKKKLMQEVFIKKQAKT